MFALLISLSLGSWSAEVAVGTPPANVVRAPSSRAWFATATGWDDAFLVGWQDFRFADSPVVMVARMTADGGVEDPIGLTASNFNSSRPALSARGGLAAVAWESRESSWLRVLRRDGQWASAPRRFGGRCPAVAMGTTGGVFVSEDGPLRAVRFNADGVPIDVTPINVSGVTVPWSTCAKVAIDDSGVSAMVMWRDENTQTVWSAVLPMVGPLSTPTSIGTGAGGGGVALVATGADQWFGVSAFFPAPPAVHLQGYELTSATAVQVPFLSDAAWLSLELDRCAAGLCFAATSDGSNISLTLGSFPLDGGAATIASTQSVNSADWALAATRDGQQVALARADSSSAHVSFGGPDFAAMTPLRALNDGQPAQFEPDVAVLGDTALVAWLEQDATSGDIVVRGRRFSADGAALDPAVLTLLVPGAGEKLNEVELMADESAGEWIIATSAWDNERSWLVRVKNIGTIGTAQRLAARGMHLGFALAGKDVLATAKQYQTMWWDPVMVTIAPDGTETTTRMQDNGPKEHFTDVAVTANGERLVVWQDVDPNGMLDGIVAGKRVAPDGTVLDAAALRFTPPGADHGLEPQVVGDGVSGYFLVSRGYRQLWAQHIANGVASTPKPLLTAPLVYDAPGQLHLASSGDKAVVSFADPSDGGVLARELSIGSGGFEVTPLEPLADVGFVGQPAIAVGSSVVWAAYARADTTANALRVFVRTWQRAGDGTSCTAGYMCKSNTCAGVCVARPDPVDAGTVNDAGVIVLPDGGAVLPDGGAPPTRGPWELGIGASCSSVEGPLWLALSALLVLRRRR